MPTPSLSLRSTFLTVALFSACYLTKPGRASLSRALHAWVRQQQGLVGEMLSRGALLLDSLTGPPSLAIHDIGLFVVADLSSVDEDCDWFAALGILGQWIGIRLNRGGADRLAVFHLGSAVA